MHRVFILTGMSPSEQKLLFMLLQTLDMANNLNQNLLPAKIKRVTHFMFLDRRYHLSFTEITFFLKGNQWDI